MKKFLTLLFILIAVSHFGTTQVFAQKKLKPREVIIIEFLVSKHNEPRKDEVPINRTLKVKQEVGGGSASGCGECTLEQIAAQPSEYIYRARAFRMGKDKANVGYEIEVDGECKTRKNFTVYRNQQTKIQLNCGVSLVAYYGFENEEAN